MRTYFGKKIIEPERRVKYRFLRLLGYTASEARRLRHFPVQKIVTQASLQREILAKRRQRSDHVRLRESIDAGRWS